MSSPFTGSVAVELIIVVAIIVAAVGMGLVW